MSTTQTATHHDLEALIATRAHHGLRRFGVRHLSAAADVYPTLAHGEAVDCGTYLHMHRLKAEHHQRPPSPDLREMQRLNRTLIRLLSPAGSPDPARQVANSFNENAARYGTRYLQRCTLTDALEEIADCLIFLRLDDDRHWHQERRESTQHDAARQAAQDLGRLLETQPNEHG